jgi:hypothetical protein
MNPHPSTPSRDAGEVPLCAAAYPIGRVEQKAWKRVAARDFALIA